MSGRTIVGLEAVPRNWPLDLTRAGLLVGAVFLHGVVGVSLAFTYGTDEFARRDWWAFRDAGQRVLEGRLDGLYTARPGGFPFLHPPYVAALFAPVGGLGDVAFYGLMVALQVAGLAATLIFLRKLSPRHEEQDVVLLGILASAPWAIGLVLGQPSALVIAVWLGAFWLVEREKPLAAGVLFGLSAIKPPFVVAPVLYAMLSRRHRVGAGIAAGMVALFAISLFVGSWPEWLGAIRRTLDHVGRAQLPLWKQHTFLAFARSVAPRWLAFGVYALLCATCAALFCRHRGVRMPTLRVAGRLALGTIALSPFAYFYDALLLAIPAAGLWLCREDYPKRRLAVLATVALLTFVWQYVGFFALQAGPAMGGLLVATWLILDLLPHHRVRELDREPDRYAGEVGSEVTGDG